MRENKVRGLGNIGEGPILNKMTREEKVLTYKGNEKK